MKQLASNARCSGENMAVLKHARWSAALLAALVSLGCTGADGKDGLPGPAGVDADAGPLPALENDVSGTVTDGVNPLANVAVTVAQSQATATTDAAGAFSLPGLAIGAYFVTFHLAGYVDQTIPVAVNLAGPTKVSAALAAEGSVVAPPTVTVTNQLAVGFAAPVSLTATATGTGKLTYLWKRLGGPVVALTGADTATLSFTTLDFPTAMGPRAISNARFGAIGLNPDQAGNYDFELTVTDPLGQATTAMVHVDAARPTSGLRMVPLGVPVLLQGDGPLVSATQTTWSWTLDTTGAVGSAATIINPTSQFPSFVPEVMGTYVLKETVANKTLQIYAGTWMGEMTTMSQNTCTLCHNNTIAPDMFTPWKGTRHYAALQRSLDGLNGPTFSDSRLASFTVGYDQTAKNGGFDDAAATASWTIPATLQPGNYAALLATPALGQLAGIQCESCHGPQGADSHGPHANSTNLDLPARISWSSDACASCHQDDPYGTSPKQWAMGKHADLTLALSFGTVEGRPGGGSNHCGRCHSAQGFGRFVKEIKQGYVGNLTSDGKPLDPSATPTNHLANDAELASFGMTQAAVEPQSCPACHDSHDATNPSQLRVYDKVAALPNGLTNLAGMGTGMICATCHNSRNGEHTDFATATPTTNGTPTGVPVMTSFAGPHAAAQTDALFGFNAYFVNRLNPSPHLAVANTCSGCHHSTPTAAEQALGQKSNHSFAVDNTICASCHSAGVDGVALQATYKLELDQLRSLLASKTLGPIAAALNAAPGATLVTRAYDPLTGLFSSKSSSTLNVVITSVPTQIDYAPIGASAYGGAATAGLTLHLPIPVTVQWVDAAGNNVGAPVPVSNLTTALSAIKLPGAGAQPTPFAAPTANVASVQVLYKAYWNMVVLNNDNTFGIHNPGFYDSVLSATSLQLKALP
jgi:hypothetical protein